MEEGMRSKCGDTYVSAYQAPGGLFPFGNLKDGEWMAWECMGDGKPWEHTVTFPPTARGRADGILAFFRYQEVEAHHQVVCFSEGRGTVEIFRFHSRRHDKDIWYKQDVQATRPVDGTWFVRSVEVRGERHPVVVLEPLLPAVSQAEWERWFLGQAAQISQETWDAWARKAGLERSFSCHEKEAFVAEALRGGLKSVNWSWKARQEYEEGTYDVAWHVETCVIAMALDGPITADVLRDGFWSD